MATYLPVGFDEALGAIGLGEEEMENIHKTKEDISAVLYELDDIMKEENLYEKYPMRDRYGNMEGGNVFTEYDNALVRYARQEVTNTPYDISNAIVESSLRSVTELLQETLGKEYGIDFSYSNAYSKGTLEINGEKYDGERDNQDDGYAALHEKVQEAKSEIERE